MKRVGLLVSFATGRAIFFAAFGIGWGNWWEFGNRTVVVQTLIGALVVVVLLLVAMAFLSKGKERCVRADYICNLNRQSG